MKLSRVAILMMLIVATLIVTLAPALAFNPNLSFDNDANHDGVPDFWRMRGEVVYDCAHPAKAWQGDCFVIFPPSQKRAFIAQRYIVAVPDEELKGEGIVGTVAAAQNLEPNRVFVGIRFFFASHDPLTYYIAVPGGTYEWTNINRYWHTSMWPGCPDSWVRGFVSLPHAGSVAVDWIETSSAFVCTD